MIDGKSVLAIIPARGGSKGVPRKNVRNIAGKPMIGWTIEAAKASKYIDRLVLSSDDDEIIDTAKQFGCEVPYKRPEELSHDDALTIDVIMHAMDSLPPHDIILLLQPTNPLRKTVDIDATLSLMIQHDADSCVSVSEPDKSPYWMYAVDENSRMEPLLDPFLATQPRQALPPAYVINGAVYAAKSNWLRSSRAFVGENTVAYTMPRERSLDVDYEHDLQLIDILLKEGIYA